MGITLDAETFVAFFTAAGLMAKPIRQLSSINGVIQKGLAAANEIFDQLDFDDEVNTGDTKKSIDGVIEFKDVSFGYTGDKNILNNINLTVNKHETIAFVGKSGSGKSTLANLISRFYSDYTGQILIDGIPNNEYDLSFLRKSISIVTQSPTLFNDTIERNIAYGDDEFDTERVMESARLAGCLDFIDKLPEGINSEIGDDGVLLSGGQRQRLAIARAFYKNSPIIILDEATSALDTESEELVQESLEKLISDRTTIVIAHRLSTIENADQIVVLDNGLISQQGKHSDLLEEEGIYASLYKNVPIESKKSSSTSLQKVSYLQPIDDVENNSSFVINAWYQKHLWLYLLLPFSWIFTFLTNRRRRKYLKNQISSFKTDTPVVVVGNINIGGTGKTPLVKHIASKLKERGLKVGIVSRGYGGNFSGTLRVDDNTEYKKSGDEAQMLANLDVPLYLDKNRPRAIQNLINENDCDVILSDDGLQHYKMYRDIEIIVIDGSRRLGNGLTFPAGPLRESSKRLKTGNYIINNGGPTEDGEILMTLQPSKFVHLNTGKSYDIDKWPMHNQIHAVAGLGNPGRFFDTLSQLNFDIERHPFPDHHQFEESDLEFLDLTVEPKIEESFINDLESKIRSLPNDE